MKNSFWSFICFVVLAGCHKDKIEGPRNYTGSSTIASSDLPLGGGCVDADGNFIVFSPPTFAKTPSGTGNFVQQPSFKKYNSTGQLLQEYLLPAIKWHYFQGSYTWDTINGVVQAWDESIKVTLALNRQGKIINSNSMHGLISSYDNGTNSGLIQLERTSGIAVDGNDTVFVLLSPTYYQDRSLKAPPEILKLNPDGTTTSFYVFPSYYNYPVGSMWGNGTDFFPMDKPDDIHIGSDGYIYIAIGFANKTFKISKSGQMEELTTDLSVPVSIATDKFGDVFIVSAPLFDPDSVSISKPTEVIEIKPDKSRSVIYSGIIGAKYGGGFYDDIIPGKWVKSDCASDISVSSNGDVFLVDPIERKIVRIY